VTRIGVVFRPQFPPERLLASAEAADASGVDELWFWEDCFDHGGISTATAALARTERLHVGVGVFPVPLRNVALCAMEITTVARMFPGRLQAGVGHGVLDWMGQVGARVDSPMTLLREYTTALQALLAGERVSTAGRYVQLEDVQLGWPAERKPDLHVAAVRPKTIALAGELADGLVLTGATPPQDVAAARAAVDSARGERPGRTRITVYLMAVSGLDAEQRYERELADWQLTGADLGVAGDPDAIAAAVRRWADAGADTIVLQPAADEDPVAYARFVGEQIRPLV
jgi:alkanesulfonate monooxygenase SsuD/methylene tetrahydromethanopterin reductase-like flavin-dependent oxidoreductase (luciferase family)